MNIKKVLALITVLCFSMILVFLVTGCRGEVYSEGADREEAPEEEILESGKSLKLSELPDKELFDKYFSHINLCGARGFFGGNVEDNVNTFLPHQEGCLIGSFNFKYKKNFIFSGEVLDLKTNDFVKRCAMTSSSFESDGFSMEILEYAFLSPGSYEYRVYVEDTLVAVLPFEVISYFDYFKNKTSYTQSAPERFKKA